MKRFFTLILLSMIAFNAIHAEVTWTLSDDGTLTISGTDMPDYAFGDSYPWYSQRDKIKKVVFEDGVINIGSCAFEGCTSLTSITIPESVTSIGGSAFDGTNWYNNQPDGLIYVGRFLYKFKGTMPTNTKIVAKDGIKGIANYAFNSCSGLTSIIIANSVTSIGNGAFLNCSGLTSITLPNSLKNIGRMSFWGCQSLTSITLPNSVTSIGGYAFGGSGLTSITIPNSVTNIEEGTFWACSNLNSLTISNGVVCIRQNAFSGCNALTSITIPKSVTNIETNAFPGGSLQYIAVESGNNVYDSRNNCKAIIRKSDNTLILGCVNTTIPNSVTCIGENAFSGCNSITSITIPNSVISIGGNAFSGCSSITSVTIPNSVTSIGVNPFSNCSELYSIIVESDNSVYDSRENCNSIIRKSDNALISGCINSIIPNGVTIIGDNAFCGCKDLISINIPYSVTSIGYAAFSGCSLTSVTIPNKVTNIGNYAFYDCASITSVTIPNSVTNIGENAFSCRSDKLKEITINVNKDLKINKGAFFHSNIEKVTMYGETLPAMVDDDPYEGAFSSACYTATLSVPSALYEEYCSTSPWNKFTKIEKNATTKYLTDAEQYANNSQLYDLEISYTRTFNNTAWQALYIPFSMSYSDWKDDFEVAYINNIRQLDNDDDGVIDKTIMDVVKIKDGSLIPNTPYLIKAKSVGEKTISVSNTTLYEAKENSIDCRTTIAEYTFTGTYNAISASTLIANNYYTMGGGALIMSDGNSGLNPYRWYMKIEPRSPMYNVSNAAKTITINVVGEEEAETTGVNDLQMTNGKFAVYDLNGRKVNENNLKPGIYIKNGKKVIIK